MSEGVGWLHSIRKEAVTFHVHRSPRVRPAADAKLPVIVVAPALDHTAERDDARVRRAQGDGDGFGGDAWRGRERVC